MTTEETSQKTEQVKKSDPSVDSMATVVSDLIKTKDTLIEKQSTDIEALRKQIEELQKEVNKNPVDQGTEEPQAVKATDSDDVGTKADAKNYVAPKPSEAQASIIPPAVKEPGKDEGEVSMENKSDYDKPEEKKEEKEEMKKEDYDDDKKDHQYDDKKYHQYDGKKDYYHGGKKEEEMKKSDSIYKVVEPVRPILKSTFSYDEVPTAYSMLKAVTDGTYGTDADAALTKMELEIQKGTFGSGRPTGGIF